MLRWRSKGVTHLSRPQSTVNSGESCYPDITGLRLFFFYSILFNHEMSRLYTIEFNRHIKRDTNQLKMISRWVRITRPKSTWPSSNSWVILEKQSKPSLLDGAKYSTSHSRRNRGLILRCPMEEALITPCQIRMSANQAISAFPLPSLANRYTGN